MHVAVLLADSVTALGDAHAGQVVVTGSHGGLIAAHYAAQARVRAVVFNDAGRGLDDAGIAGLPALARIGIPAVAVSHLSARIGDAADTLANGVIAARNAAAASLGIEAGQSCSGALNRLAAGAWRTGTIAAKHEATVCLMPADAKGSALWAMDSIGLVDAHHAGATLIIGSHGGLHGGDPATALPVAARAAIFHDAGRGKDDAGVTRLPVLEKRGIAAVTADYRTARIGDGKSLWATGVVSCANATARACGVTPGASIRDACARLRRHDARNAADNYSGEPS